MKGTTKNIIIMQIALQFGIQMIARGAIATGAFAVAIAFAALAFYVECAIRESRK